MIPTPKKAPQGRIGKYLALRQLPRQPDHLGDVYHRHRAQPAGGGHYCQSHRQRIFHLSWGTWALAMLLPGLVAMLVMPLVIYAVYPPEIKETPNAAQFAKERLHEMGPIEPRRKNHARRFSFILLMLWAGIPAMIMGDAWKVDATTTALIGLSLLLLTGVLSWDDILKEKSAWDTITWFAALVMMATFLNKLGLITWFSGMLESGIGHLGLGWMGASALLLLAYMYAHYMFASTTAHITAMLGAFLCGRHFAGRAADAVCADDGRRIEHYDDASPTTPPALRP